jgi:glycosyltransferase involved in cell wall biosynthesis/tRNA A-37 threonylcarbamoyl transferase component Bud32
MKIVLNPRKAEFETFIQSVHETFDKGGKTIYKQRNEIKVFNISEKDVNVKQFKVPNLVNRIIYTFFRRTKAERSYEYALKLKEKGIDTPEPIAYVLMKKNGLIHTSYYVSMQIAYEHTMYEFGRGGISGREHIIKAFARYTAELHEQGVYHKDYSPGNILFQEEETQTRFCLVDINRMLFGDVSVKKGCANFARLWGQKEMFSLMAKEYAHVRKASEDKCLRWILYYRNKFWKRVSRKRPAPFNLDKVDESKGIQLSVIFSTYNQPEWLEKVLWGYEAQTTRCFEVIIADDGSGKETTELIEYLKPRLSYPIKHVWHENNGFQKCKILNAAILAASTDYLLFSDGDCIPRKDFVITHLSEREKGRFLSGGYSKLPMNISQMITKDDIISNRCFNLKWLKERGLKSSFRNNKFTSFGLKKWLLNHITTTTPTWNGHNASGWLSDIMAVNGFDERMQYGGQDREFGERLENNQIRGKQIRYSAICVHLDHARGYKTVESIEKNKNIRKITRREKTKTTGYGIIKKDKNGIAN